MLFEKVSVSRLVNEESDNIWLHYQLLIGETL